MENNNQKQVTFEDIENNEEINEYINKDEIKAKLAHKEEFCLMLMKLAID